ncbi:PH-domain-containing protein [Basidiobolus meristosporus CBS 931.73]|uniref:PH-domain-containing protein n=1 Tax=Basidiobolus meristosporus CBS 931.73 TaxID=1314790 RepID=A0A1Y1X9W9_9FUNG|nr:PH-domain-containing protein [Basidiobolus meristosporus CBS 931.73]|eukprot:ORX82530.1 PH-domain-containing protein [Basidiobolus meristosporus CBS 931.73]
MSSVYSSDCSTATASQESLVYISQTLKRGYLTVRGAGIRNWLWTKRLIILKNLAVTIHKHENDFKASDVIYLDNIVDIVRCDARPYCFKLVTTLKTYFLACRNEAELSSWMDDIYKKSNMKGISSPTNFHHDSHLGFNPDTGALECAGKGFENMQGSTLTREDYASNPNVVLSLMNLCTGQGKHDEPAENGRSRYRYSIKPTSNLRKSQFQLPEIPKKLSVLFDDFDTTSFLTKTQVN